MDDIKYTLRYLSRFYDDLEEKILYIAEELQNPQAANDLLDEVEQAIIYRLPFAESFEPYYSLKERKNIYYRIYVQNFVVYYVVINDENDGKVMEVRRLLYNRENTNKI